MCVQASVGRKKKTWSMAKRVRSTAGKREAQKTFRPRFFSYCFSRISIRLISVLSLMPGARGFWPRQHGHPPNYSHTHTLAETHMLNPQTTNNSKNKKKHQPHMHHNRGKGVVMLPNNTSARQKIHSEGCARTQNIPDTHTTTIVFPLHSPLFPQTLFLSSLPFPRSVICHRGGGRVVGAVTASPRQPQQAELEPV